MAKAIAAILAIGGLALCCAAGHAEDGFGRGLKQMAPESIAPTLTTAPSEALLTMQAPMLEGGLGKKLLQMAEEEEYAQKAPAQEETTVAATTSREPEAGGTNVSEGRRLAQAAEPLEGEPALLLAPTMESAGLGRRLAQAETAESTLAALVSPAQEQVMSGRRLSQMESVESILAASPAMEEAMGGRRLSQMGETGMPSLTSLLAPSLESVLGTTGGTGRRLAQAAEPLETATASLLAPSLERAGLGRRLAQAETTESPLPLLVSPAQEQVMSGRRLSQFEVKAPAVEVPRGAAEPVPAEQMVAPGEPIGRKLQQLIRVPAVEAIAAAAAAAALAPLTEGSMGKKLLQVEQLPAPVSEGLAELVPGAAAIAPSPEGAMGKKLLQENAGMLVFAPALELGLAAISEPTTGRKLKQGDAAFTPLEAPVIKAPVSEQMQEPSAVPSTTPGYPMRPQGCWMAFLQDDPATAISDS